MGYAIYAARAGAFSLSTGMFSCRRLTSLQQTRLVSQDADRSRRSQCAPTQVILPVQQFPRRTLLGNSASGIRGSRDAEKLKASQDEGAEVQNDEEEYHYHDRHQYEVVSTHNTRPSVACFPTYGYAEPTYTAACNDIDPCD